VNYFPVINGNDTFFAKIQPALQAHQPTEYDLMVITNGTTLDKLIKFAAQDPDLRTFEAHLPVEKLKETSSRKTPRRRKPATDQ